MSVIDRKTAFVVTGLFLLLSAFQAQAALQWNFSGGGGALVFDNGNSGAEQTFTAGAGNPTVNVSGWSDEGVSGDTGQNRLVAQDVRLWSGLGVQRGGESSPQHGLDNNGPDEMILFEFSSAITLTQIRASWYSTDSDITLLAYTNPGTPDLKNHEYASGSANTYDLNDGAAGSSVGLTADGWTLVGNYYNIGTSATNVNDFNGVASGAGAVTSSYWLVGALNWQVNGVANTTTYTNDYLKITMLAGDVYTPPPPNGNAPLPGAVILLASGFMLLLRAQGKRLETNAECLPA